MTKYTLCLSLIYLLTFISFFFFFNDTATTEIYTLSLHDALPISRTSPRSTPNSCCKRHWTTVPRDRKSTRLNSSHSQISYAVFCLKKKKKLEITMEQVSVTDKEHGNTSAASFPLSLDVAFRYCRIRRGELLFLFFFNDTATTEIYTLSLHDALPIFATATSSSIRMPSIRRSVRSMRAA